MSGAATPPPAFPAEPAKRNNRELIASVIGAVVAMALGVFLLWLPVGAYIIINRKICSAALLGEGFNTVTPTTQFDLPAQLEEMGNRSWRLDGRSGPGC